MSITVTSRQEGNSTLNFLDWGLKKVLRTILNDDRKLRFRMEVHVLKEGGEEGCETSFSKYKRSFLMIHTNKMYEFKFKKFYIKRKQVKNIAYFHIRYMFCKILKN